MADILFTGYMVYAHNDKPQLVRPEGKLHLPMYGTEKQARDDLEGMQPSDTTLEYIEVVVVRKQEADALADALDEIMHLYNVSDVVPDVRAASSFKIIEKIFDNAQAALKAYRGK